MNNNMMIPAPFLMATWALVIWIILAVLVVGFIVLIIIGRHMQKKQEAAMPDLRAGAQQYSMLIIDKKHLKLKDSGLPQIAIDQTPKYARGAKVPIVKAKVGPRVMNLMCDEKIFDDIPLKKEVKALVNGIYIIEVKGIRGTLKTADAQPEKKKGFFSRFRRK